MKHFFKGYSIDILIKWTLLMGFAFTFLWAIVSGDIGLYVHPRNNPFVISAGIVFIVMGCVMLTESNIRTGRKIKWIGLVAFALPLLLMQLNPNQSLKASALPNNDVQLSRNAPVAIDLEHIESQPVPSDVVVYEESKPDEKLQIPFLETQLILVDGTIVMDDDNFYAWLNELYESLDDYVDKEITFTGFVFRLDEFNETQFVGARMLMVCCAADMQLIGLFSEMEKAHDLEEEGWYHFKGQIEAMTYGGDRIPGVRIKSFEKIDPPRRAYVYPF